MPDDGGLEQWPWGGGPGAGAGGGRGRTEWFMDCGHKREGRVSQASNLGD